MANTRTKDLDVQSTRTGDLLISVDKASGFTRKKVIRADVLAPKINELSTLALSNRATNIVRWNDGSGNEYKTTINDVYTKTKDLDTRLPAALLDGTFVRVMNSDDSLEYNTTLASLSLYISNTYNITNQISTMIAAALVAFPASLSHTLVRLSSPNPGLGNLYLERYGKLVNGIFVPAITTAWEGVTAMPEGWLPRYDVHADVFSGTDHNNIILFADGSIKVHTDFTGEGQSVGISYILP